MHLDNQHWWNIFFTLVFLLMITSGIWTLLMYGYRTPESITVFEFVVLVLATLRLTRLVLHDKVSAFVRDQFYDRNMVGHLVKPQKGIRRTLADLLSCPWCFGMWAGAVVVFFFLLSPLSYYVIIFFAIAGAATLIQILGNLIGWHAEKAKQDVEG